MRYERQTELAKHSWQTTDHAHTYRTTRDTAADCAEKVYQSQRKGKRERKEGRRRANHHGKCNRKKERKKGRRANHHGQGNRKDERKEGWRRAHHDVCAIGGQYAAIRSDERLPSHGRLCVVPGDEYDDVVHVLEVRHDFLGGKRKSVVWWRGGAAGVRDRGGKGRGSCTIPEQGLWTHICFPPAQARCSFCENARVSHTRSLRWPDCPHGSARSEQAETKMSAVSRQHIPQCRHRG